MSSKFEESIALRGSLQDIEESGERPWSTVELSREHKEDITCLTSSSRDGSRSYLSIFYRRKGSLNGIQEKSLSSNVWNVRYARKLVVPERSPSQW